jgi:hypothetical protein
MIYISTLLDWDIYDKDVHEWFSGKAWKFKFELVENKALVGRYISAFLAADEQAAATIVCPRGMSDHNLLLKSSLVFQRRRITLERVLW